MKESNLERDALEYLAYMGGIWFKTHDAKHRPCVVGIPDIIGVMPVYFKNGKQKSFGQFVGIEMKRPGQKANGVQLDTLARIRKAGGRGFVACSLADIQEGLR